MTDGRDVLERAQAGSDWIDALLALFWACNEAVGKDGATSLPPLVREAWRRAEDARQTL